DRVLVLAVDGADHDVEPGGPSALHEALDQRAADTTAPVVLPDVDGVLHGGGVAGPLPLAAKVAVGGEPDHLATRLVPGVGDEDREALGALALEPARALLDRLKRLRPRD